MSISPQKPGVWKKLLWLTLIFIALLYLDYTYHEHMVLTVMKNYEWFGFYRFGEIGRRTMDFRYSADVLIGAWSYVFIFGYALLRKRLSTAVLLTYPVMMIVIHFMTII